MPQTALMTIIGKERPPTLEEAAAQIGVKVADLSDAFGVVLIDPGKKIYAVEVREAAIPATETDGVEGPYSNPRIDTMDMARDLKR